MNIIDLVSRNHFVKKLFPDGLTENVFIGQIAFDVGGRFNFNIHTKQKPVMEVEKWGLWGKDYNVIVIKLNGNISSVKLKNWQDADYSSLIIDSDSHEHSDSDNVIIHQVGETWNIKIECCKYIIFNSCDTYFDSGKRVL